MIHATIIVGHDAYDSDRNDTTVDIRNWLLEKFPGSTVIETNADQTILQLAPMSFDAKLMSHEED